MNSPKFGLGGLLGASLLLAACERPPVDTVQRGYRGVGLVSVQNPRRAEELRAAQVVPVALPAVPAGGPTASDVYQNVQVPALAELNPAQFTRLMTAITLWVAPEEGCNYCHAPGDLASDDVYTKVVSRRMIEMTIAINSQWSQHVGETGVTCFTCHRGQHVPQEVWFTAPDEPRAGGFAALHYGQNHPGPSVGLTSLPYDPLSPYLSGEEAIRMQGAGALPTGGGSTIKATEQSYGLMMHMSQSLGVNCTYCHNTRAFQPWAESSPARVTAWHGIQLARQLNVEYLEPLTGEFPAERLGPLGDVGKVSCATCHRGAARPLNGAAMAVDYPELGAAD